MKNALRMTALIVAALMLFAACTGKPDTAEPTKAPDALTTEAPEATEIPEGAGEYTYRVAISDRNFNWSPHGWQMADEAKLLNYIEAPLFDISIAEDGKNFAWVYEMASSLEDITATYPDRDKWLAPDENGVLPTEGVIYRIGLNPEAKWQDGTPINADTYIYSMQQALSPMMTNNNYRYNTDEGKIAIKNAAAYSTNDPSRVGEPVYAQASFEDEGPFYINFSVPCEFFNSRSAISYYEEYPEYFTDGNGVDILLKYCDPNSAEHEYEEVTEEIKADLITLAQNFGYNEEGAWKRLCFVVNGEYELTPWEDVGLIAEDDYTLIYICEKPVHEFDLKYMLRTNWIVYEPLYEAGKTEQQNGHFTTDYGTSLETTMSCGPYKLVYFDREKQFILERNENWYGWTDGKHEGQYQTTRIVFDVVSDNDYLLSLFLAGELDEVALGENDIAEYASSDNLLRAEETYVWRYVFATDLDKLAALEQKAGDGCNKKVLYYDDFRKAISLAINRAEFCEDCTAGYKPAYFLLNDLFYYDIDNNSESRYRGTEEGREAVLRLYGAEYGPGKEFANSEKAYESLTGYDVEAARALFRSVYEQAIADGLYEDGQEIRISCKVSAAGLSETDIRQQDRLNEYVAAAAAGTGFEGRITFEFAGNAENRYRDIASGKIEMIRAAWGGAAFYPFSSIRCYCEPDYMGGLDRIHESCGWDPTCEVITIDIGGKTVTDTIQNWARSINEGGRFYDDEYADIKLLILSDIEYAILSSYQCIPYATQTTCRLVSDKISYPTTEYNLMYGFGGVRLMTYNCDDAEWAKYVAECGGTVEYR